MNNKILGFLAATCVFFFVGCNGRHSSQQNEDADSLKALEERLARLDIEVGELYSTLDDNNKYGYADSAHHFVIPAVWEYADNFSEGLAVVGDSTGKEGYIDKTGKVVIPCTFVRAYDFCGGMAAVNDSRGKFGFIDKTGKLVVPCVWDFTHGCFNDQGLAAVWDSTGLHVIDKTGAIVEWDTTVSLFKKS